MSTEEGAPEPVSRARNHIIERPRLTKLLDESKARILLLVAPAGYGKTTLARQWLGQPGIDSTWLWARPTMADVAVLAVEVARACEGIVQGAGERMRDRLLATHSPDDDARELAELLAGSLFSWPDNVWLVIDDYHHLIASRGTEAFVEGLLDSSRVRALITTRIRPSWLSGRRLVYGDAYELGQQSLMLTHREAVEILRRANRAATVVDVAKGWPAVIGLAALNPEPAIPHADLPSALYSFFAEELYNSTRPDIQRALRVFTLARTSSRRVADFVFGSPEDLSEAARQGFLTITRDRVDLHPLLADFLETKVDPNSDLDSALEALMEFVLAQGAWDEAFSVLGARKTFDALLDLLQRATDSMLREGRLVALAEWISVARAKQLGGPVVDRAEAELAYRQGSYHAGETLAVQAARASSDRTLSARCWLLAGRCAHLIGRNREAYDYHCLQQELTTDEALIRSAIWGKFVSSVELDPHDSAAALDELCRLPVRDSANRVQLLAGRLDLGRRFSGSNEAVAESALVGNVLNDVRDPLIRTHFLNARAAALIASAAYREAAACARRELAEASDYRLRFVAPHALVHLAGAYLGLRRFRECQDAIKKALTAATEIGDVYSDFNASAVQARFLMAHGQHCDAAHLLDVDLAEIPIAALREEYAATRALALACAGDPDSALELCRRTALIFDLPSRTLLAFAKGVALRQLARPEGAAVVRSAFRRAIEVAQRDCCVQAYRSFPPLLLDLLATTFNVRHVQRLIEDALDSDLARSVGIEVGDHAQGPLGVLSSREREVLNLLAEGLTNREIGHRLFISESTAKVHVRHILKKLSVRTRTEAALFGSRASY
jgi:ATP/maltotriose-dependent transcriptional regulator MalT